MNEKMGSKSTRVIAAKASGHKDAAKLTTDTRFLWSRFRATAGTIC